MIKLKALQLQGFRKFKSLTRIEFPESGLMLIDGDSGAGKSTVLQAIAYALDICPHPATTLKSWSGEKLQVNLTLDVNGQEVVVSRGTVNSISKNGETRTGSKALEEGLRELFGMSPDLLGALTYRPQDQLGLFLSKSDPEKKQFLAKVLGLESIEAAIDIAQEKRKELQAKFQFAQGVAAEREASMRAIFEQLTEASPDPDGSGLPERVASLTSVLKTQTANYEEIAQKVKEAYAVFLSEAGVVRTAHQEKLETAKKFYEQFKESNKVLRRAFDLKFSGLKDQVYQVDTELGRLHQYSQEISKLTSQLNSLKANRCFVCHQTFSAEVEIDSMQDRINTMATSLESEPLFRKRREDLLSSIEVLEFKPDEREAKFATLVGKIESDIESIGKNITDPRVIDLQQKQAETSKMVYAAKQDLADAQNALHQYNRTCEVKATQRAKAEASRAQAKARLDEATLEAANLETVLNAEKDFLQVLGRDGFLGVIFDEVLTEVAEQANETLGKLSNTSHVSVHFRSETEKGKKSIVPVFVVSGHETTRSAGLSGGMGTSADLAVDLGIAAVVEGRLGSAPGWLCLDESFNGMPKNVKEAALEILQQFSQDRLVLVVDHGTELQQMFNKVLTVQEVDGKSVV